jgi:hypothetical protein
METGTLHVQVRDALIDEFAEWIAGHPNAGAFDWNVAANNALAALGLDDLDVAVERGAKALVWEQHQGCVQWDDDPWDSATSGSIQTRGYARDHARAVLTAALTPTEGED